MRTEQTAWRLTFSRPCRQETGPRRRSGRCDRRRSGRHAGHRRPARSLERDGQRGCRSAWPRRARPRSSTPPQATGCRLAPRSSAVNPRGRSMALAVARPVIDALPSGAPPFSGMHSPLLHSSLTLSGRAYRDCCTELSTAVSGGITFADFTAISVGRSVPSGARRLAAVGSGKEGSAGQPAS
jgi:hypothetical protein